MKFNDYIHSIGMLNTDLNLHFELNRCFIDFGMSIRKLTNKPNMDFLERIAFMSEKDFHSDLDIDQYPSDFALLYLLNTYKFCFSSSYPTKIGPPVLGQVQVKTSKLYGEEDKNPIILTFNSEGDIVEIEGLQHNFVSDINLHCSDFAAELIVVLLYNYH